VTLLFDDLKPRALSASSLSQDHEHVLSRVGDLHRFELKPAIAAAAVWPR
jgi:hypothetical protein